MSWKPPETRSAVFRWLASEELASAADSRLKARRMVIAVEPKLMLVAPGVPPAAAESWIVKTVAETRAVM